MTVTVRLRAADGTETVVTPLDPVVVPASATLACLIASAGTTNTSVVLRWSEPIWPAGSTNRRYEVWEDLFSANHLVTTVTVPTRTSGSLAAASYRYYVVAKDSTGTVATSQKVTVAVPISASVSSPVGCTIGGQPPPPPPGLPALWNAAPPAGVCPNPTGPNVGTPGQFDAGPLATNEVWDHFDGAANSNPDSRLWLEDTINQGGTQTYDPARSFLDGSSHAVLEAIQSGGVVRSGRFTSRTKFNMKYGWLAARIKFPNSTGTVGRSWFPACWILHVDFSTGVYGEIDLMEFFGNTTQYSTHLFPGTETLESTKPVPSGQGGNAANAYHTYWMMWESQRIQIGVDDFSMGIWTPNSIGNQANWAGMQSPHYWILNFAVHPDWLPAPVASDFPARVLIDWVWYKPLELL